MLIVVLSESICVWCKPIDSLLVCPFFFFCLSTKNTHKMLPSCILCKKRKKRCDFNLPNCKHCETMGTPCEYYDEGLGNNVPREYLKSLDDSISNLKNEIQKYKMKIEKRTTQNDFMLTSENKLYNTVKNGTFIEGSDSVLHYFGPCSLVSMTYMSSMMLNLKRDLLENLITLDYSVIPQVKIPFDYSMITSDHSKILISNYLANIYPVFPLLSDSFFHFDLMIKNYPETKQLFILLILLISSAHIMRKRSDFVVIKIMLQQKVLDLMKIKLTQEDGDSLLSLILYAIYELFDPEVGKSVWKTLSLACDIAERLQVKNLNTEVPLPGTISKDIPRSNFLKILVSLDTRVSLCLGKPPHIALSKNQVLIIQDDAMREYFLNLFVKTDLFYYVYSNTSGCDISHVFDYSRTFGINDPHLWLMLSPMLSHRCSKCDLYFDLMVIEILSSSLQIIDNYLNVMKPSGIHFYWFAITDISIALINLLIIKSLYHESYLGMVQDEQISKGISQGQKLITQISSQWYYANYIKSFIELASMKTSSK